MTQSNPFLLELIEIQLQVSPIALPILLVAVLLFIPLSANFKTIACFLSTYYVLVITLFKLIFDAYEGFIDYPNFCNVPRLIEWLYWIGLISDDARPALVCLFNITSVFTNYS